jgi:hypothetical protein
MIAHCTEDDHDGEKFGLPARQLEQFLISFSVFIRHLPTKGTLFEKIRFLDTILWGEA